MNATTAPPKAKAPRLNPHRKHTLGLLLQSMKFLHIQYGDELRGTGAFLDKQKYFVNKITELFEADIALLYKYVDRFPDPDEEMKKYYEVIDFVNEVFETACVLSEQREGLVGIPLARKMLEKIKADNFATVDELPEGIQSVKEQLNQPK